jgi:hypothetical protein
MIYKEFDDVERPPDKTINNDKKLDRWMDNFREKQRKKLMAYHKDDKTIDRDPLSTPTLSYGKR